MSNIRVPSWMLRSSKLISKAIAKQSVDSIMGFDSKLPSWVPKLERAVERMDRKTAEKIALYELNISRL